MSHGRRLMAPLALVSSRSFQTRCLKEQTGFLTNPQPHWARVDPPATTPHHRTTAPHHHHTASHHNLFPAHQVAFHSVKKRSQRRRPDESRCAPQLHAVCSLGRFPPLAIGPMFDPVKPPYSLPAIPSMHLLCLLQSLAPFLAHTCPPPTHNTPQIGSATALKSG